MKQAIITAIIAILGFTVLSANAATNCPDELPESSLTFKVEANEVGIAHDKTASELAQTMSTGHKFHTLGYTTFGLKYRVARKHSAMASEVEGQICVTTQATIYLQIDPEVMHIAKDLPEGTCAFDQVVKHEREHVQMNQDKLNQVVQQLNAQAAELFASKVWTGRRDEVIASIAAEIRKDWAEQSTRMFSAVDADHEKLDSVDYAKNDTYCGGEILALLTRSTNGRKVIVYR